MTLPVLDTKGGVVHMCVNCVRVFHPHAIVFAHARARACAHAGVRTTPRFVLTQLTHMTQTPRKAADATGREPACVNKNIIKNSRLRLSGLWRAGAAVGAF